MRRAIVAGAALGIAAGLLFVYHDALRLTVAWPVVLGFALWGAVGRGGARGLVVALGAAIGVAVGYGAYAIVAEFLPITTLSVGLAVGVAVGLLVLVGVAAGDRLPVPALLVGFAAFAGMFEPLWAESPAAVRTHGIETLTVALLGVVVGTLGATVVRAVTDRIRSTAPRAEREAPVDALDDAFEGSAS